METNTETQDWVTQSERPSPDWDVSRKLLPSGLRELCGGVRKSVRTSENVKQTNKETTPSETQDWCSCELSETVAACTGPAQVQVRWGPGTEMGKWTWSPIPTWDAISSWQLLTEENPFSSMESHRMYKSHSRVGPMLCNRWLTQSEPNSIWERFLFHRLCLGNLLLGKLTSL